MMLARLRPRVPVADGLLAVQRDSGSVRSEPAAVKAFFKTLDATLKRTVKRKLTVRLEDSEDCDWRATAILGALNRYEDGRKRLPLELLKGGPFVALPSIPVAGMEDRNRYHDARDWAAFGTNIFVTFLAGLGPIFMGVLERALTNAAEAEQRKEHDQRATQKRDESKVIRYDEDGLNSEMLDRLESEMLDPATGALLRVETFETPEDTRSDHELAERITKRFPKAVGRYFLARIGSDLNQKRAAKAVGIDPRTAREYERLYAEDLRSLLDGQSPRKSR
jgi:hypothetical protein